MHHDRRARPCASGEGVFRVVEKDGYLINLCPSFLNVRGHVWMTLQLLFDVPMSLSDLHFLCPFDFEEFCEGKGYELE